MKRRLMALILVAVLMPWPLVLTDGNWWAFILATVAILAGLRLLLASSWREDAGLGMSKAEVLLVLAAFAVVAWASTILLRHVSAASGLKADPSAMEDQVGFLFQAFNEEILFRALLLGLLVRWLPSAPLISLVGALLFALAHFLLYRFSNPMHVALSAATLATLVFAGVALNNLYLSFRHVGYSWALHAGWNVAWLPAAIFDSASHQRLSEPLLFIRILGSPVIVAAACTVAALSFAPLAWHRLRKSKASPL